MNLCLSFHIVYFDRLKCEFCYFDWFMKYESYDIISHNAYINEFYILKSSSEIEKTNLFFSAIRYL